MKSLSCDFNCHVGTSADGFDGVHGGKGYGARNAEGEMLLELAAAMKLCVVNTWFQKEETKIVTYESGGMKTVVDFVLMRRKDLATVRDTKAIPGEACLPQHKLLVCVLEVKASLKRKRKGFVSKRRVWKLKDAGTRQAFEDIVSAKAVVRSEGDINDLWNGLKTTLLEATKTVCGERRDLLDTERPGGGMTRFLKLLVRKGERISHE